MLVLYLSDSSLCAYLRRVMLMSFVLEEISHPHLPWAITTILLLKGRCSSIGSRLPGSMTSLSASDIIVGTHLQVLKCSNTKAKVNTEITNSLRRRYYSCSIDTLSLQCWKRLADHQRRITLATLPKPIEYRAFTGIAICCCLTVCVIVA